MIYLSQTAAKEIKRLKQSRGQSNHYFRLGVKSGGCSGLFYTLDLTERSLSGDRVTESEGIKILVDEASLPYLENLKLDYAEDLMGGGFRFSNPNAANPCSCGLSFVLSSQI
jgi:iron-sulfur cluster assembly accessory protein